MSEVGLTPDLQIASDLALCSDAIIALVDVYASPLVTLIKTLDHIIIATGATCPLRVAGRDGGIFDTAPIRSDLVPGPTIAFCHALTITPYLSAKGQPSPAVTLVRDKLMQIAEILENKYPGMMSEFNRMLALGIADAATGAGTIKTPSDENPATSLAARDQLGLFLADAFATVGGNDHKLSLSVGSDQVELPRILLYYRQGSQDTGTSTWLHDDRSQRPLVVRMITLEPTIGTLLGSSLIRQPECGAVSQSLFHGVCRWIELDQWRDGHALTEASIRPTLGDAGSDGHALIIPIHVGGLPWLGLVITFPTMDARARRLWSYHFYRDLLPTLTSTIRQQADTHYLRAIRNLLDELLARGLRDLQAINAELGTLADQFPYAVLRLDIGTGEELVEWPSGELAITQHPNRSLGADMRLVDYRAVPISEIKNQFELALGTHRNLQMRSYQDRLSSYVAIGHTLKNVVSTTGHMTARRKVAEVRRNLDALVERGTQLNDPRVTTALDYAARSLSLFSTVEGLGHFIRLAGAQSGQFAWRKFANWAPLKGSPLPSTEIILTAYATAIFSMLQTICFGSDWSSFKLEVPEIGLSKTWAGEEPQIFSIADLHFPPFSPGSDVGFLYLFCLAEPVINATRALQVTDLDKVRGESALTISLLSQPEAPGAVRVDITNLSHMPLNEALSGWESTKRMLMDIGMGQFDVRPESRLRDDGLYQISTGVRFNPQPLLEQIWLGGGYG